MILGIDEVGRGPWAGPLVVGAVVLGDVKIEGLTDSKKLSKKKLLELDVVIRSQSQAIGIGWVSNEEIDTIGLSKSLKLATIRAVEQIDVPYHEIIIDGTVNFLAETNKGQYVTTIKKADLLISSVSAASIVAKVARDNYMTEQATLYPDYGFENHVGYGTDMHQKALSLHGLTPLHRISFKPIAKIAGQSKHKSSAIESTSAVLSSKNVGDIAESIAAKYLVQRGHEILDRNWKTKICEIDIVTKKRNKLYFVEVKYRKQSKWGDGMEAIGKRKLRQMKFASDYYVIKNKLDNVDRQLVAMALSGEQPQVDVYLEIE